MKRSRVLIVGSGSAGLFCAWALADRADVTVVKAGPDPSHPLPPHRLLIADASVMPVIPQANTNLPAMMIGVRAGQMLAEVV